jgi:hypothetical protein
LEYRNIRTVDGEGREVRTVVADEALARVDLESRTFSRTGWTGTLPTLLDRHTGLFTDLGPRGGCNAPCGPGLRALPRAPAPIGCPIRTPMGHT